MSRASSDKPHYYYPGTETARPSTIECDICIYGATSAGVTAAVQAAKAGKKVALVAFGRNIGGMTTSGLSATDTGNTHVIGGLSREFYRETGARYGKEEAWLFEPHVASGIYRKWLEENHVPVYLEHRLTDVETSAERIVSIKTNRVVTFKALVFIDAGYEGDLMAQSGVSYRVGRESDSAYTELFNGIQYGHHHHFLRFVDPYERPGDPKSGLLPGVSDMPLGTQGNGDNLIQAYNFRLCLTRSRNNKVPFWKPDDYEPRRYELLRRYIETGIFDIFNLNRQIPGGKTDYNNWGAVNSDYIGGNYGWPEGDYDERERIYQDHVRYQMGMLYFLANDPRLPRKVRAATRVWGLAADEFTETSNWPPELYVREARRMISDYVITEHDSFGQVRPDDSIGMATYRMDSHNCKRVVYAGRAVNEGNVEVSPLDPMPISYRAIRPKRNECRNLLVPVCLSASHIAYGTVRMEPVFMILGQAAAVAACLAIDKCEGIVQDVDAAELRRRIEQAGIITEEPDVDEKKRNPRGGRLPQRQPGNTTEQAVEELVSA
ncbi:MAG: FAD-dependent oxidoreductase [Solirubrobacterales bacterium]